MIIKINKLIIRNFKSITYREIDFGGGNLNISGANGTGKTTIYDAFYWLLFNKDSKCRADFDIKPLNTSGEVADHGAQTEVIGHITFNGVEKLLRKVYYEKWTTKRGNAEAVYDGNTAEHFIDELPVSKTMYDASIEELCREKDFQLLSNLTFFNEKLKWEERRAILFGMIDPAAADALLDTPEYKPLKDAMGEHSIDDFKKVLQSRRKTANDAKKTIPARIDECNRTVTELKAIDFFSLESDKSGAELMLEDIKSKISEIKSNTAAASAKNELDALENEYRKLILDNEEYRQSQTDNGNMERMRSLESVIRVHTTELEHMRRTETSLDNQLLATSAQIADYRKKWAEVNGEEFKGLAPCPTCGREYDEDAKAKAQAQFEINRGNRLNIIIDTANSLKSKAAELEKELSELRPRIAEYDNTVRDKKAELEKVSARKVEVVNMPGYTEQKAALEGQKAQLETAYRELCDDKEQALFGLMSDMRSMQYKIDTLASQIAQKGNIERSEKRIDELNAEAASYTEQINHCDMLTDLIERYTKARAALVEESINGMFRYTRFKLYDVQINGGLVDCCEATYNGIEYNGTLNDGHRILVALDIINTLSEYYGISVPLFFDNAERYTGDVFTNAQTIKMTVSNAKELIIEGEEYEPYSEAKGISKNTAA